MVILFSTYLFLLFKSLFNRLLIKNNLLYFSISIYLISSETVFSLKFAFKYGLFLQRDYLPHELTSVPMFSHPTPLYNTISIIPGVWKTNNAYENITQVNINKCMDK